MVHQLLVLDADATAAMALQQQLNCIGAHAGSQDAVVRNRGTAALNVAEDGGASFTPGFFLDVACQLVNVAHVLGDRHDSVFLTFRDTGFDFGHQIVTGVFHFRHHDELTAAGNRRRQGQVAAVTAHHFHHGDALV